MVRPQLSPLGGRSRAAEQGFTLIETMVAMSVSIVVLLANIYLLNTAHKDLTLARSLTAATNLATGKIADFRALTIDAVNATTTMNIGGALAVRKGCEYVTESGEVLPMLTSATVCRCKDDEYDTIGKVFTCKDETGERRTPFKRTWVVSAIDIEHTTPPVADLVGNLVKIKIDVRWPSENNVLHDVSMTTFAAGNTR